jgi:hypothetical protein
MRRPCLLLVIVTCACLSLACVFPAAQEKPRQAAGAPAAGEPLAAAPDGAAREPAEPLPADNQAKNPAPDDPDIADLAPKVNDRAEQPIGIRPRPGPGNEPPVIQQVDQGATPDPKLPRIEQSYFLPHPGVTAPRLGTFTGHPWWRRKVTDADIAKIVAAIANLPAAGQALYLHPNGNFAMERESPSKLFDEVGCPFWGKLCGGGADTFILIMPEPGVVRASLAEAKSMLAQGIDAAHASEEMYRKKGRGYADLDEFDRMRETNKQIPAYKRPPMGPISGGYPPKVGGNKGKD